jgi:hypothetical protein
MISNFFNGLRLNVVVLASLFSGFAFADSTKLAAEAFPQGSREDLVNIESLICETAEKVNGVVGDEFRPLFQLTLVHEFRKPLFAYIQNGETLQTTKLDFGKYLLGDSVNSGLFVDFVTYANFSARLKIPFSKYLDVRRGTLSVNENMNEKSFAVNCFVR